MPFEPVQKGKFRHRQVLSNTVSVEPAGNGNSLRFIVAADIAARFPGARYVDLFVGIGEDAGAVRIVPCQTAGENSYKNCVSRMGHMVFSVSRKRLGIDKAFMPKCTFHPPFTAGEAHITVNLDELTLRRAARTGRAA